MKRFHFGCLALACLFVGVNLEEAKAAIQNGGFETGDLTNWTASLPGLASVVTTASYLPAGSAGTWSPAEGTYFALLRAGAADTYTLLSQEFTAAAGQVLSFSVFFDAGDYIDDDGYVSLLVGTTVTPLYAKSVVGVDGVGENGQDGWTSVSHEFLSDGTFTIEAGVRNYSDNIFASQLGLDNVSLSNGTEPIVPEPTTLAIWGTLAGLGLVAGRRRKRVA